MAALSWEASNLIATVASAGVNYYQSNRLHGRSTTTTTELHFQALAADLLAATKEADRDVWEQRNGQFNNMLVASSVLFGIAMACILEGSFDEDQTQGWVVALYLVFVALSIGSLFASFVSSMLVMQRMSVFMIGRADLFERRSSSMLSALSSGKAGLCTDADLDPVLRKMKTLYEREFKSAALEKQASLEVPAAEADAAKSTGSFYSFYHEHCRILGYVATSCFYCGAVFVWMSICVLVWNQFPQSTIVFVTIEVHAALVFSVISALSILLVLLAIWHNVRWTRRWKETRKESVDLASGHGSAGGQSALL